MLKELIEILLIEDEPAHAELVQRAFEERAPHVRISHTPTLSQARQYLIEHRPSLIITDWHLPDGDGLDLIAQLNGSGNIPLIFMTSYGNERVAVEAIKAGALDYVVKSHESLMDLPHIAERAFEHGAAKAEQTRMQRALSESEGQFQLLAENASDMISRLTSKGIFMYVSPACLTICGYEPQELIGRAALDFIHADDLPKISAIVNGWPHSNLIFTISFRARRKDGEYVWLESSAHAILDGVSGQVQEIQTSSRNITERKQAEEALVLAHRSLQEAYDRTIEGWVKALDLRDRETEGHTQRVSELTVKIAGALGLPESEIVHVRRGALLHDIGKIGISDEITKKTGPLNEREWGEMRKHPQYAYDMLSPIAYLHPALEIPYCHHERWDGSGYPRGLKGEQIPLTARLFAIIDVWDALTSDRPYRKATPREEANAYLRREAGRLFDPLLVELFLEILRNEEEADNKSVKAKA
jgi:PAS domain S-box-containing protein